MRVVSWRLLMTIATSLTLCAPDQDSASLMPPTSTGPEVGSSPGRIDDARIANADSEAPGSRHRGKRAAPRGRSPHPGSGELQRWAFRRGRLGVSRRTLFSAPPKTGRPWPPMIALQAEAS